ncbi:MAG: sugar phosphate isomerase/epimerase [Planctomycetaceae bacterium]|nr:sugar phosphate isomerase/epimerase [Planctomycetaceae bacterium]
MTNRRDFLKSTALAAATASFARPAFAAGPIERPYGPKMKLSLAAYSFRSKLKTNASAEELASAEMTLNGFIDYCASLGLDGTELTGYYFPAHVQSTPIHRPPTDLAAEDPASRQARIDAAVEHLNGLKNHAFRLGLDISGTAIGNDFCLPEGPGWVGQINLCKDWIDRAAVMGAPVIRIFAGKVPEGESEDSAIKRCATAIDECLKYAARRGVFLALENHGGITATPAQMLKIIEAVQPSPWFGVNFDSGNFQTDDPYRDLALIAPYAVNAQIKVAIKPNGKKEVADFARIIDILNAANYRGYLVLEYEEPEDPLAEIPRHIEQLRKILEA